MNRIESSAARQVSHGAIAPLEFGVGVRPVACTPIAIAAIGVAAAATAYYAFRDYNTKHMDTTMNYDSDALESITGHENHLSVGELTGAIRGAVAG